MPAIKPRILIVDDDEDARALYGGYLRRQSGWEVVCTDNGQDALNLLDSSFHAVVLDEEMPGMRGVQVLKEIRSRANLNHICVVMLTATDDKDVILEAWEYNPKKFLPKMKTKARDLYIALERELSNMENPPVRPARVFLSHSHVDEPAVWELYYRLKRDFVEPWLDKKELVPGQDWRLEILKAVRDSDIVVVCLSSRAVGRAGYLHQEIRYALEVADQQPEGSIFIIPLKLDSCEVPEQLRKWQWVNMFEEGAYDRLLRAIQVRSKQLGLAAGK